jgi:class 3 adenylate cyclase
VSDKVNKSQFTNLFILKKAIFYLLPLVILMGIILGIFFYKEIMTKKNITKIQVVNIINMQIARIGINFTHIVTDLIFFASYHQTLDCIENLMNPDENRKLSDDISLFSRGSKIFDQIRILDPTGMEILRVDFSKGKPVTIPKDRLQFKGERYYFKDTFVLKRGEVFISPFDLNIEHGLIEKPLKPMIRFGTPIYNRKGQKQGILLFNYLGATLIQDFKNVAINSPGLYMLLNSDGYWIIGRDSKDEWGFMYEDRKDRNMGNTYPEVWQKISSSESGQFFTKEGLFTFTTFYPVLEGWKSSTGSGKAFAASEKTIEAEEYCWKVVSYIPDSYFIQETNKSLGKYIYIGITIILVLAIMTWFLAQAVVRRKHAENELQERNQKLSELTEELGEANKRLSKAQEQISKYIDPNVTEKIFQGEFSAVLSHQRKKLTMFFSDIKDFTQFTDASDPEDVANLLNEYLGEMAQIVRAWGGTIPQFTGDSIYAIFGAPDSKGEREDGLACVRMAVEMQRKMKALREKWWNQGIQFPFEIRCGIHSGMANVGNYGSEGFMEYSAIGLNTNLASRLEQACQPGEIYLSHATWALVNDEIPCEEVGTIEVKGFHYPIQTYRVLQGDLGIGPDS